MKANRVFFLCVILGFINIFSIFLYTIISNDKICDVKGKNQNLIEYEAKTSREIESLKEHNKPVVVVFGADYCSTCVNYKPYVRELSLIYGEELIVKYIDTTTNKNIRKEYNVELVPSTLFFYSDGTPYIPSNELDVMESNEKVAERRYISERYEIVKDNSLAANTKFEYGIDNERNLAYCKYVGFLDMQQLEQIMKELLQR